MHSSSPGQDVDTLVNRLPRDREASSAPLDVQYFGREPSRHKLDVASQQLILLLETCEDSGPSTADRTRPTNCDRSGGPGSAGVDSCRDSRLENRQSPNPQR